MKIYNFHGKKPCIYHFQGHEEKLQKIRREYDEYKANELLECPDNLTIITTYTDENAAEVCIRLRAAGIPWINAIPDNVTTENFCLPDKIKYIASALEKVTTKYVLIVDAYDVVIRELSTIIPKFHNESCRVLFNATINKYPLVNVDALPFRDYLGNFRYFNAGCCIGYTEDVISIYKKAETYLSTISNNYGSEQYILRHVFRELGPQMLMPNAPLKIDYQCNVFCCLGNALIYMSTDEYNDTVYIVT